MLSRLDYFVIYSIGRYKAAFYIQVILVNKVTGWFTFVLFRSVSTICKT